jgi:hypothetical protein
MHDQDTPEPAGDYLTPTWMAERAIVLQLLRDDHDPRWMLAELKRAVSDIPGPAVRDALRRLRAEGVAVSCGRGNVLASRCAWRLSDLELIGV